MVADIPSIDNCCDKEAYAFFGLASYWAQVLEHSALNLAVALRLPDASLVTKDLFDDLFTRLSKHTFGQLLKVARGILSVSDDDVAFLDEALELRNILTHHYFRIHAEDFLSVKGRDNMKRELQLVVSKFQRADAILERMYRPLYAKYGVTEEFIENELADLSSRAEQRDNEK